MRILVTGGAGFIGSHLVDAYCADGHDVCVIDNLVTGRSDQICSQATFYELDILSPEVENVFIRFRPEIVNHHAAQSSVKVGTADPSLDLTVNAAGTARIARLSAQYGCQKLIYASSGGTIYGEAEYLPIAEDHPKRPLSNYGLSKYVGELYIEMIARSTGLNYSILRYGNAYGPRQDPRGEAGVVSIFAKKLLDGEPCTIDGDGEQRKDYVYVLDLVRANYCAHERGDNGCYNIGSGVGVTVNTIFELLRGSINVTACPRSGPPRPGDVRNFWLDSSRAKSALGWTATVPFEEGVDRTANWLRTGEKRDAAG
jgi:UDP-glucose 4-epimerase